MPEKSFAKSFRRIKTVQLCILIVLEIAAALILICNPVMGSQLFTNKVLLLLYVIVWILMLFNLCWLLYDFVKIKQFAEESHSLNKIAYLDNLTGIPNRHGLDTVFKTYDTPASLTQVGCFMCKIDNLRTINDTLGHTSGDKIILDFCSIFEEVGDDFGFVGRNGGNEFLMVMDKCTSDSMNMFIEKLQERVTQYNEKFAKTPIQVKHTYLLNTEVQAKAFTQLLTATYNKLHS